MALDVLDLDAAADVGLGRLDVGLAEQVDGARLLVRVLERVQPVHAQVGVATLLLLWKHKRNGISFSILYNALKILSIRFGQFLATVSDSLPNVSDRPFRVVFSISLI